MCDPVRGWIQYRAYTAKKKKLADEPVVFRIFQGDFFFSKSNLAVRLFD